MPEANAIADEVRRRLLALPVGASVTRMALSVHGGFVADRPMRIAITAIGYGDGYPRLAPSGSPVVVRGVRTRTVGRVSMDLLAIDVTALPEVQVGDRVELWGKQLPVEEVAAAAGTISYELTCGITRRVRFMER